MRSRIANTVAPPVSSELRPGLILQASPLIRPVYSAFDGLRAIAFLLVFLLHYGTLVWSASALKWGWIGVDIFFVLSGFLITGILFDSLHHSNFFSNFYMRRALRIFPVFYGFFFVLLVFTPLLHIEWNRYNVAMAAFLGNAFISSAQLGLHPTPGQIALTPFHHTVPYWLNIKSLWSLCVEEQFYFIWPAVVWWVRSRKILIRICLIVIAILPLLRLAFVSRFPQEVAVGGLYFASWARIDTLLVGAALALWLRGPSPSVPVLRKLAFATLFVAPALLWALILLAGGLHSDPPYDTTVSTIGFTLIAFAAASLLLLSIAPASRVSAWLRYRPLASLGRMSYGLYFFHGLPIVYFSVKIPFFKAHHMGWSIPILAFAYTLITAALSFYLLEAPFLRLKDRFFPKSSATPALAVLLPSIVSTPDRTNAA